jgi:hypothetical protein
MSGDARIPLSLRLCPGGRKARYPLRVKRKIVAVLFAQGLVSASVRADEGQWPVDRLKDLDRARLDSLGFRLPTTELFNESGGLMRATVNLGGCSAAFVSKEGLIATNHHCAYRAIQAASTPAEDHLKQGFVAKERKQEIQAKGYNALVLRTIRDVTPEIRKVDAAAKDDFERAIAIERKRKELVAACEKKEKGLRCDVATFSMGDEYKLFESVELTDIRLVYAPPAGIGEFGGEIDNWTWPRHTGDFALLRAYTDTKGKPAEYSEKNSPYRPAVWLGISADGVKPGDFVAVLGYPGRTTRYLRATEVERQLTQVLPGSADLLSGWVASLEKQAARGKEIELKVAAQKKSFANVAKNSRGMLDGISQLGLLAQRKTDDERLATWLKAPGREKQTRAVAELDALSKERRESFERELVLQNLLRGPNLLNLAIDLVRRAKEGKKPDLEREEPYMERNAVRLWKTQERRLRDFDAEVDATLLATLAVRAKALPKELAIDALARLATGDEVATAKALAPKLRGSTLPKGDNAKKLFDAPAGVDTAQDFVLGLARALVNDLEANEKLQKTRDGRVARIGPDFFQALRAVKKQPFYPDANGTLRLSYATVTGYSPKDGLVAEPQTTLAGAVKKHTGKAPFDLPKAVLDKATAAKDSYWADPGLKDVSTCFLSNADTTGGNSGSPVIDRNGKLVGLNFDRVWENIAGDYAWGADRSRNISVDIRYMLWLLDRVSGADRILEELGVAGFRSQPTRRGREAPASAAPVSSAPTSNGGGCGCRLVAQHETGHGWLLAAGLLVLGLRRRERK